MTNLLYYLAIFFIIVWAIGFFGFGSAAGSLIHILLVLALISVLVRVIRAA